MSEGLYDVDGIDGPFERRMEQAMREDTKPRGRNRAALLAQADSEVAHYERLRKAAHDLAPLTTAAMNLLHSAALRAAPAPGGDSTLFVRLDRMYREMAELADQGIEAKTEQLEAAVSLLREAKEAA
jgi:hypothetical protein